MYEILNTTKKDGHHVGEHKNGWHIGLAPNHFLGPGKKATVESVNQDFLELQRQGLISIRDIGTKKMTPVETPIPVVVKSESIEQAVIDEAAYPDGEPNFVVRAPSLNTETETIDDAPTVTVDSLKNKKRK